MGKAQGLGSRQPRKIELRTQSVHQLIRLERRIEQECHFRFVAQALEQGATQRRLSRADFARDGDEALTLVEAIDHMSQRLAVRGGEKMKTRVGGQPKRLLAEAVVRGVH